MSGGHFENMQYGYINVDDLVREIEANYQINEELLFARQLALLAATWRALDYWKSGDMSKQDFLNAYNISRGNRPSAKTVKAAEDFLQGVTPDKNTQTPEEYLATLELMATEFALGVIRCS